MPDNPIDTRPQPRWVADLLRKLGKTDTIDVLPQIFGKTSAGDNLSDEASQGEGEDEDENEDGEPTGGLPGKLPSAYDRRFRLYGLAFSPGGGMSALLTMSQAVKGPERDNWHNRRSSLLFDFKHAPQRQPVEAGDKRNPHAPVMARPLTTEGRMIEYMYGGGSDVSGVTTDGGADQDLEDEMMCKREALRVLFHEAIDKQTCDIDQRPLKRVEDGWECGWHAWGACGTSGLAIMVIGMARKCGVCGSRTLPLEVLAKKLPAEKQAEIEALAAGDVCGRCGGKFLY